jgi:hypothetical protein
MAILLFLDFSAFSIRANYQVPITPLPERGIPTLAKG